MAPDTASTDRLAERLRRVVGRRHVLTGAAAVPFATGYRYGSGPVEAVVRPGSLVEMWRCLSACVAAGRIVIAQAANTGLTGGSTPDGSYDRKVVILSTSRIRRIFPILGGEQVVCLAGATLHDLERRLAPLGREPHSVIGSSCIGASVVGGVCNNSGGALVQRGPAFTQYALFARLDADGELRLHNALGIALGDDPEAMLHKLEGGWFDDRAVARGGRAASAARDYEAVVRAVDAPTPARYNADPARLFEASGCAGKVIVFAVRLDSFPRARREAVFYVGTNDPAELTALRRRILTECPILPVSGEYIHREAFDLADRYGKDVVVAIRTLGAARLPGLFRARSRFDRLARGLRVLPGSDRLLQAASRLAPDHLPPRMRTFRDRYAHHLILRMADEGVEFARALLGTTFPSGAGDMFECSASEANIAMLHRFAVAGAAVRYRSVHGREVAGLVALDVALPRNADDWFEKLPPELEAQLVARLYYGHFFCHVFHQDYLVRRGCDPDAIEARLLKLMDSRGAVYPAEHNVGHHYRASPALADHYRRLDPANAFNPGLGGTSRRRSWQ